MTQALPLWTIRGPELGSKKWFGRAAFVIFVSLSLVLAGCTFSSFVAAAEEDIPVVIQMITNITTIIAPGYSAEIQAAGTLALAGLKELCGTPAIGATKCDQTSLIGQYQASASTTILQKIDAALTAVNTHISSMLALAKGLSSGYGNAIVVAVGIALSTVTALMGMLPAAHLLAAGKLGESKTAIQVAVKPERAKQLKAQFNLAIIQSFPQAIVH